MTRPLHICLEKEKWTNNFYKHKINDTLPQNFKYELCERVILINIKEMTNWENYM